jgi:hypothetical protein
MNETAKRTICRGLSIVICLVVMNIVLPTPTKADVSVVVINETGYDLGEVKYVHEIGETKSLVGQTRHLSNGNTQTFNFQEGGAYRVYASLVMGGKTAYAKGNANYLRNNGNYRLTLKKVMVSQGGSGILFIKQSEFDSIK